MRLPVPDNRLVTLTLAGALLTAVVAGVLAMPGGLAQAGEQSDSHGPSASESPQRAAGDAPTPNQEFTPAVQSQSSNEDGEYEDDEHEDDEHEVWE